MLGSAQTRLRIFKNFWAIRIINKRQTALRVVTGCCLLYYFYGKTDLE